jgi:hypothetical protein
MKKEFRRFAVWSNMFYLIPLVAAWYFHLTFVAIGLFFLTLFSFAFHVLDEKEFVFSDISAAVAISAFNIFLLYLGGFRPVAVVLVALLATAALFIHFILENGDRGSTAHGYWHVAATCVTLACILVYALR